MGILTSKPELTDITNNDLIHVVNVEDTIDNPAGSSRKLTAKNLRKYTSTSRVVIVESEADFPTPILAADGVMRHPLARDTTYILAAQFIEMATPLLIPTVLDDLDYERSTNIISQITTNFQYTGTASFMYGRDCSIIQLKNLDLTSTQYATCFDLTGNGDFFVLFIDYKSFYGWGKVGRLKKGILIANHMGYLNCKKGWELEDLSVVKFDYGIFAKFIASDNNPFIEILGKIDQFSMTNQGFSLGTGTATGLLAGESALMIDAAITGNINISNNAFPNVVGAFNFQPTLSAAITAFADSTVSPGVKTKCTIPSGHKLVESRTLVISSNATYNGTYKISNVTTATFDIIKVFAGAGTATYTATSLTQLAPNVNSINNGSLSDSDVSGSIYLVSNATATSLPVLNAWVKVAGTTIASSTNQRASMSTNNRILFSNKNSQTLTAIINLSCIRGTGTGTPVIEYTIFKNGSQVLESGNAIVASLDVDSTTYKSASLSIPVSAIAGDYIELFARNTTNTSDLIVRNLQFIVK